MNCPAVPAVGSVWCWEPLKPWAVEVVQVMDVRWNGDEWWITSRSVTSGEEYPNSLSRWVEATVLLGEDDPLDGS